MENWDPIAGKPVLPMFIQMNVRFSGKDESWREVTRWVKFREDVEDGGKRWSKPYVPSIQLTSLTDLKKFLDNGIVALDGNGNTIDEIIDSISELINSNEVASLKTLLNQRVKLRMKINLVRMVSNTVISRHNSIKGSSNSSFGSPEGFQRRSLPPRSRQRSSTDTCNEGEVQPQPNKSSSTLEPESNSPHNRTYSMDKERIMKLRTHNLFMKKVPRGAECCNILAATVDFVRVPKLIFIRLRESVLLDDYCEIPSPSRFLAIILGPPDSEQLIGELGRALGALMSDQIFPLVAYKTETKETLLSAIDSYIEDVTVLPPSAWDPSIRLEPPKSLQSLDKRLNEKRRHNSCNYTGSNNDDNSFPENPNNSDHDDNKSDNFPTKGFNSYPTDTR